MTSRAAAIRPVTVSDHAPLVAVLDDWWDGPPVSHLLHRLFFEHFADTSFVAEHQGDEGRRVGLLIGFLSQTHADEAYIRFVAVHPEARGRGVGRALYERFFAVVGARGRSVVRCVTSPGNAASLAFHARLGFAVEPGDGATPDGVPVLANYDGRGGGARVRFVKWLTTESKETAERGPAD